MRTLPLSDLEFIVGATARLWEELRGRRVFFTGGTGFFGCWLLESFCYANMELGLEARAVVLTRRPEAFFRKAPHLAADPAVTFVRGDVRSFEFPRVGCSHIVHAAADSCAFPPIPGPQMHDTIVSGTRRVLDFARHCEAEKLLLLSSGAVYGPQPPELTHIDESFTGPETLSGFNAEYGEGKRLAERLCREYAGTGLECKIARCFGFVGPHLPLDAHFAIGNFIGNALRHEPIRVKGDGTPLRSYLYMADAAVWLWNLLFRAPSLRPYNVGSEKEVSIADLARTVADVLAPGHAVEIDSPPRANGDGGIRDFPSRYIPSTRAARDELGLFQTVRLAEAIRRTAEWYAYSPRHHSV